MLLHVLRCWPPSNYGPIRLVHGKIAALVSVKPIDDPGHSLIVSPPAFVVGGTRRLLSIRSNIQIGFAHMARVILVGTHIVN